MNILFAAEMVGTYNGLEPAFKVLTNEHGATISFAAADALHANLAKKGVSHFTRDDEVEDVFRRVGPDLVIVGVVSGVKPAGGTGLERDYALAALDAGVLVVVYRDFYGLHPWIDEVAQHQRAANLLHFFMFDPATARLIRELNLSCVETIAVGSGYYDEDATRDWASLRAQARTAMGWTERDIVVVFSPGATRDRVLQALVPTVAGLQSAPSKVVFVPTFHPKDPDAPYTVGNPSVARPSDAYDPVINRLNGRAVLVVREPAFRNPVSDGKARVAAANIIVMNTLSTDTYTAMYAGVPVIIPALPITRKEAGVSRINLDDLDFIKSGAMDLVSTADDLERYVEDLPANYTEIRDRLLRARANFQLKPATPGIVENLLRVARS